MHKKTPYKKKLFFFFQLFFLLLFLTQCKKETVFQEKGKPEVKINSGDSRLLAQTIHFYRDTVYVLNTSLTRENNQELIIDAGVLVKVNDRVSITINPGAKIEATGTMNEPIVFTSSAFKGGAGIGSGAAGGEHFWYGIRIYGDTNSQPGTGSGVLSYVRIEFAGGENNGLPSLLLKDITPETKLENIQVSYSFSTSSFELNGGNCNASDLVSYASSGNDFDIRGGYNGMLQHLLAYRHPYFAATSGSPSTLAGVFIDGVTTFPAISNLTVIGPDLQKGTNNNYIRTDLTSFDKARTAAVIIAGSAKFHIRNSSLFGFPKGCFYLDDKETAISLQSGESDFEYSVVHSNDSNRVFYLPDNIYPPYTAGDFKSFMLQSQFGNQLFSSSDEYILSDPFNYDINPDPSPEKGSPILSGANFEGVFSDAFFKKVTYRGAQGMENWMQGWINFIPLQTNYNN